MINIECEYELDYDEVVILFRMLMNIIIYYLYQTRRKVLGNVKLLMSYS